MRERKITTEGYRTNRTGEQEFMQIVEWIRKLASSSRLFFFIQPQSSTPNRNGNLCDVEYPRCSAGIFILHVDMNATRLDWNIPYEDIWAWNIPCDLSYIHLRCTISRTWWSHERGSFWQLIHFLILQRFILVLKTAWLIIGNQQLLLTHLRCLSRSIHLIFNLNHSIKVEVKIWSN